MIRSVRLLDAATLRSALLEVTDIFFVHFTESSVRVDPEPVEGVIENSNHTASSWMAGFKGSMVKMKRQNAKVKNMNCPDEVV
jgi:hypothetical protein